MKALFARDRWKVQRMIHLFGKESLTVAKYTRLMLVNRYSGKVKTIEIKGHWEPADFPGDIYRGVS